MGKQKVVNVLYWVVIAVFLLGWSLLFFGIVLFQANGAEDYRNEKEIKSPETVYFAAHYPKTDLVYVFYETGEYLNVYDTFGNFKWAFNFPFHPNGGFEIRFSGGKIYYYHYDTYVVDAEDGRFIETVSGERAHDLIEENEPEADVIATTLLKVEYKHPDGQVSTIVSKSPVIMILYYPVGLCIAGLGAVPLFIMTVVSAIRKKRTRRRANKK